MQTLPWSPRGFRSCARNIGIRDETLDFTVIASDVPAAAAAMFTQNRFCGPGVIVGREHVANGQLQAFVINSKNANVATGEQGLANIREVVHLVAEDLVKVTAEKLGWHEYRTIAAFQGARIEGAVFRHPLLEPKAKGTVPDGTLAELKRFYYDTAQTSNKSAMSALAAIIPPSQIVFGTDFPYRTGIDHVKGLREAGVFTDQQIASIERGNALKLIPRLAS